MREVNPRVFFSSLYQRFQGSLFYLPAVYVLAAGVLAWATTALDGWIATDVPELPFLLPTTVESARSILSTIAGATITVAGVVFSLTIIAVQLTASQFSPRVLRGLLQDRTSQNIIGVVVATFTFCLLVLAVTRSADPDAEEVLQNVSVTVAVVLSVIAVLAIVKFLDHSARSMRVGEIIRRVTAETHDLIERRFPSEAETLEAVPYREPETRPHVVTASREGWIQQVDTSALLRAVPAGATVRLDTRAGAYVTRGRPLASVWADDSEGEDFDRPVRRAFAFGHERTMQQDVAYGIRQLVDIALRAMSTGINDPTTTIEVLFRLGGILQEIELREMPPRAVEGDDGRRLLQPSDLGRADFVRYQFRQIRVAAIGQPGVIKVLVDVLGQAANELRRRGLDDRVGPLCVEARLAVKALERQGHIDEDVTPVRDAAREHGLI